MIYQDAADTLATPKGYLMCPWGMHIPLPFGLDGWLERRPKAWSRHWSYERGPKDLEVWAGRWYCVVSVMRRC